jgi:GTP cyclohydrolase I
MQSRTVHADGLEGERLAREAVVRLLQRMGQDPNRDGLRDTPRRVVAALREMTSGYHHEPVHILSTTFQVDYDELVILRDLEFTSLCEHHLMPFTGICSQWRSNDNSAPSSVLFAQRSLALGRKRTCGGLHNE